jgi:hypothetical protein
MKGGSMDNRDNTNEWRLLVFLCKQGFVQGADDAYSVFSLKNIDWTVLMKYAKFHRVKSLMHQGMMKWSQKHLVPVEILEHLKMIHHQRSFINLDHTKELIQIVLLLEGKGVEVIPYKGVVLAQEAYQNIGLRDMSDIDILIKLEDFDLIKQVFRERGYVASKDVPTKFEATFFKQNFEYNFDFFENDKRKYHAEPHWKIGFKRWQTNLDFHDILPFTRKKSFFGTQMNILTPEGLLLTTSLHHGGEDRWNSIKYISDVAAILYTFEKELNWELLIKKATKLRVINIILLGVGVAVKIFGISVPDHVYQLASSKKLAKHVKLVDDQLQLIERTANINTYFKDIRFHFSLRKSPITKFKVLYYHFTGILVPTLYDVNEAKNSGKHYRWLFLTKPLRIWRTHIKSK